MYASFDALSNKVMEKLAANKQRMHRFLTERFSPKELNEVRDKRQCHVKVSNRFTALEDLDAQVDVNSGWKTVNMKISAKGRLDQYEFKKHKPWFDKGSLKLVNQR
jgi:hypothetical protein